MDSFGYPYFNINILPMIYWTKISTEISAKKCNEELDKAIAFKVSRKVIDYRHCVKKKIW